MQRTLVGHARVAIRLRMINEDSVFQVLTRINEVQAEHGELATGASVIGVGADTH